MSDEAKIADSGRSNLIEWVKSLGLPIASLFVTAAIFFFQSQQQAFERQLQNVEDGYRFYFEHRTPLEKHADADQEETLLKLISSAFPNVYCNVRADLHARVAAAEAQDAANGFGEDDREILLSMLKSHDTPERAPLTAEMSLPGPWHNEKKSKPCPPLDTLVGGEVPQNVAAAGQVPPLAGAATEVQPTAPDATDKLEEKNLERPAAADASGPAANPKYEAAEKSAAYAREAIAALDPRIYRVFFHLRDSGVRDTAIVNPLRAPMAMRSFRIMRGVERVAVMPTNPEVRYFGKDEEGRAKELAALLSDYFSADGLRFNVVAIGDKFPNMPKTTLEVWVPDPSNAAARSVKPSPIVGPDGGSKALAPTLNR